MKRSLSARDLPGLVLVSALAIATVRISEVSGWMELPPLVPLCFISILTAALLAGIPLSRWLKYALSLLLGVSTIIAFAASGVNEPTWTARLSALAVRLKEWWQIVSAGDTTRDNLPLVLLLLGVMWLIGFLSAWLLLRQKQRWLSLLPSVAWIMLNVRYIPETTSFHYGVYLGALILTIAHLRTGRGWLNGQRLSYLTILAAVAVPLLAASWAIPRATLSEHTGSLKSVVESRWGTVETTFNRYFAPNPAVETGGSSAGSPLHTFGPEMVLRGGLNVPLSRVMTVYSPVPGYMRGATYEVYTGSGWKQTDPGDPPVGRRLATLVEPYGLRRSITQSIVVGSATDVIFSLGQPLASSLNVTGMFPSPMTFTVPIDNSNLPTNLPEDVRKTGQDLNAYFNRRAAQPKSKDPFLPTTPGFTLKQVIRDGSELKAAEIVRLEPDIQEVLGLRSPSPLKPGTRYDVVSSLSGATYVELRQAALPYPAWITDRYLQLPNSLPDSVRQLSQRVTESAVDPYDKALAIETYLRRLDYNTAIKAPPPNTDVVEYFLFTAPEGYCNYFASAMIVMLRGVGVPARMAVGFNQGEFDSEQGAYLVKETNAHAWPEVFFPEYGWVEFEPTPSQPLFAHEPPGTSIEEEEDVAAPIDEEQAEGLVSAETGIGALVGLALLLATALAAWNLSFRRLSEPARQYEKMGRFGSLARIRRRPSQTPFEYALRMEGILPSYASDIRGITNGYVETAFGNKKCDEAKQKQIESSWHRLRKALLLHALRLK